MVAGLFLSWTLVWPSAQCYDISARVSMPYSNQPEWQWMMLDAINRRRALHEAPPLKWSTAAANDALEHVYNRVWSYSHNFWGDHYFANVAQGMHRDPVYYVWRWYDEQRGRYQYDNKGVIVHGRDTSNFPGVIFRSFTFVGCAFADYGLDEKWLRKGSRRYAIVCNFGSRQGVCYSDQLNANVIPPKIEWPAGWTPPTASELRRLGRPSDHDWLREPPWPGYRYVYQPPPRWTGDQPESNPFSTDESWRNDPIHFGTADPLWNEQDLLRYDEAMARGDGKIPIWEESRDFRTRQIAPMSEIEIAYSRPWSDAAESDSREP